MAPPSNGRTSNQRERRLLLLEAARECFLQFGYGKTTLEDIARRAGISRPLIYRQFRNKEQLFAVLYQHTFESALAFAPTVLADESEARVKLGRLYVTTLFQPIADVLQAPMAHQFFEACTRVAPEIEERIERKRLGYVAQLLGSKERAEVFDLAVEGLMIDMPPMKVLLRRFDVLADRFLPPKERRDEEVRTRTPGRGARRTSARRRPTVHDRIAPGVVPDGRGDRG